MKRSHILLFLALLLAPSTHLSAADPAWWATRGVTTAATPSNQSPATIGQAKWMVSQALAELQDKLPGADFLALKASVAAVMPLTTPQTPAAAEKLRGVLRVGQLKAIAQPFYDRLRLTDATWLDAQMTAAGTRIAIAGSNPVKYHPYPWTTVTTAANSAPANLGQLKAVFALTFPDWTPTNADTDQDGLSDNWEMLYFGGLSQTGLSDTDGDGYSNAQEFAMASNPSLAEKDSNSNGLPDAWEAANIGKFSVFPPFTVASLTRDQIFYAPIILKNDTAATVDYTLSHTGNTGPAYTYEVRRRYDFSDSVWLGWDDISSSGTLLSEISNADDASQVVSFSGFTFPFYGKNYSEVYVSSNGILTFNTGCSSGVNQPIPGESAPPALIAPYWADLNPGYDGDIYFEQSGDRLVIQFNKVHDKNYFPNTFQVILRSNGEIRFNYDRFSSNAAVIGIQDSAKVLGLQIPQERLSNGNQTTVLIKPRSEFRTVSVPYSQRSQRIPPRTTVAIAGSLRSLTLPGAVYQAETQISQVGSSLPPQTLTARLTVVDPPTTVALTAPTAGGIMVSGNFLDLAAQATDADGVAKILFYDGDTLLGEDREPPYTCRAAIRSNGTRAFTAIAIDKYGTRTTSSPIPYTVLADFDGDGIPNAWELANGFDPQIKDADQDPDHDGYTNLEEYLNATNPRVAGLIVDADNDGMSDRWEIRNGLNPSVNDSALNPDGDLRADGTPFTNLMEFQADTDPKRTDTDSDGMPDGWEVSYSLNPRQNDANLDSDTDYYYNLEEYQNQTSPTVYNSRPDLDNDGIPDAWEVTNGLNPAVNDSALDPDADGLTNLQEFRLRTNPKNHDTDGDLMPDAWEIQNQLDPKSAVGLNGAQGDQDSDGLSNLDEFLNNTDPRAADSDGDGVNDITEINFGGDPKDPADGGNPPADEVKVIEFKVGGDYASWKMEIEGQGPNDHRKLNVVSPKPDVFETKFHKLRKNNKYKVTLRHTGTREDLRPQIWYCWEALVEKKPTELTFPSYSPTRSPGVADFFAIGDGSWLVDNRSGLFSGHNHRTQSNGGNAAAGLESFLVPIEIEPDANMAGVVGDVVKSAKAVSTIKHFVSPKKTTELAQDYVILKVTGITADQITPGHASQVVEWDGGEAMVPVDHLKRRVKRDTAAKTEVKIRIRGGGATVQQMHVWVVWWDVTAQKVSGPTVTRLPMGADTWTRAAVSWHFEATVQPASILTITDDIPDMTGANSTEVPNAKAAHAFDGAPFGDATYKWDITRQWRERDLMPSIAANDILWPASGSLKGTLPVADKIQSTSPTPGADHYPSNKVEGNDDLANDVDVYASGSGKKLIDDDPPRNTIRDGAGAVGDSAEARSQFQEFVRGEIKGKWYRVSDYSKWRFHTKFKKVDEAVLNQDINGDGDKTDKLWIDDGSASDATNTGF